MAKKTKPAQTSGGTAHRGRFQAQDQKLEASVAQLNLFDENAPRANSEALMSLIDKLNQQDWGTICFGGQGI